MRMARIPQTEAWRVLMENTFRLALMDPQHLTREFRDLTDVASQIGVTRLRYPRHKGKLQALIRAIAKENQA